MSIFVEKSGVLSTVQDLGRNRFRRFGINPNGAMDRTAARLINVLLGNDENAAILEMHFPAPILRFEESAIIALGGANFGASINDQPIENWRPIRVEANQTLKFNEKISGNRLYLSVESGFAGDEWLGSTSTNLVAGIGGFVGRSLNKGDRLFFKSEIQISNLKSRISDFQFPYKISKSIIPHYSSFPTIRVVAGADFEKLTAPSRQIFLESNFTINQNSNRMGFRLTGEPLFLIDKIQTVSSAVDFGTIQLPPDGQMIILMADHQTTGGYPRVAHVVSFDLPILAQLGASDRINFQVIRLEEAERLSVRFERDLNLLKIGVNSKNAFG